MCRSDAQRQCLLKQELVGLELLVTDDRYGAIAEGWGLQKKTGSFFYKQRK